MTALPAASAWTGTAVTEGGFKSAQNDLRAFLAGLLGTAGTQAAALAALGALVGAGVVAKSANYTVVAGDRGKLLSCTGTITITLLAAATAGAGFAVVVKNTGSGYVTIDGDLAETIDGSETIGLGPSGTAMLVCDGSGWITLGRTAATKSAGDNTVALATTAFVTAAIAAAPQTEVAVLTGTIGHGGTIPLPAGYTSEQCKWMVGLGNMIIGGNYSPFDIYLSVNASRVVTAYATYSQGTANVTANYIIIGVK